MTYEELEDIAAQKNPIIIFDPMGKGDDSFMVLYGASMYLGIVENPFGFIPEDHGGFAYLSYMGTCWSGDGHGLSFVDGRTLVTEDSDIRVLDSEEDWEALAISVGKHYLRKHY